MIRLVIFGALLGAPWCLAFAPMSWWWLGLLQLVLLPCLAICTPSARRAAVLGFTFGASAYGLGVSWLYISLNVYGGLPAWLSVLAVLVFGLYLAVFPALAIWVFVAWVRDWVKVLHRPIFSAVLWAALWTFAEWCRGVFLTGFAWLSLGDALVDSPFARLLPWLGNYGALFLVLSAVFSVCLLACCWWRQQSVQVAFSSVFGCVVLCLGILGLMELPVRTQSSGEISLAAVQPNVDQSVKFDPDKVLDNMEQLFRLGDTASGLLGDHSGGVLFFPETVNPVLWGDSPPAWRERFRGFARPNQVSVVMGSALEDQGRYFNSIVLLQGDEQGADLVVPKQRHDKRHLVPFGEFIPWGFGWFVSMLNMPMGEFQRGGLDQQPLDVLGQKLTTTVCYEDIFSGEFARFIQQARQEPTMLVNFSNLAWFGKSWALDQHAQMSRTRSAEHRKPGVRVTNTGFSGAIDEQGQWVKLVQPAQGVVWLASVEGRLGRTWFARCGDFLWFAIWFVVLVWGWQCSKPQKPYNTDD